VVGYGKFTPSLSFALIASRDSKLRRTRVAQGRRHMKEIIMDSLPANESAERENFANRKLIRPTLTRGDNHGNHAAGPMPVQDRRERPDRNDRPDRPERHDRPDRMDRQERMDRSDRSGGGAGKKPAPPEQTNAENFYYQKQMQSRTPMVIVLQDGEQIHGVIEWYDRTCIKVNRENGEPNLMIYKLAIKYMFKEGENQR